MNNNTRQALKIGLPLVLVIIFYLLPLPGLSEAGRRTGCIFLLAACYWVLEVVPIYATSLLIMLLEVLFISDKTLPFLKLTTGDGGSFLTQKQIYATFASPTIVLFLGGLFLAQAATRYQLDKNLARLILKSFGTRSHMVLLSLMSVTAVFSMFMSNTATTAMMLAIVVPIAASLSIEDNLGKALVLCIPIAANIGGIGTPIGTPPNAVVLAALEKQGMGISFGSWMLLAVPYVLVLLAAAWFLLRFLFPSQTKEVPVNLKGNFRKDAQAVQVYVVFVVTILLWLTGSLHKLPSSLVAFLPVVVFSLTGIVGKKELRLISWDILWLISGGLALGLAMDKSGLNAWVINLIPFGSMAPLALIVGLGFVALLMSTFISNTATANLLVPISIGLVSVYPEGAQLMPVVLAFSCSIAMALPISTPPNALAFGTGFIGSRDLLKAGAIVSLIGLAMLIVTSQIWRAGGWL